MIFKFSFGINEKKYGPVIYHLDEKSLIINNDLIEFLYAKLKMALTVDLNAIDVFFMEFDENIELIKVMDMSYTFRMMFFGSTKNKVEWFDVKCNNIEINNYEIGRLNIRGGNVKLYNSSINSIMFGRKLSVAPSDRNPFLEFPTSLFVDETTIKLLSVEMNVDQLKIMRCSIEECIINVLSKNNIIKKFEIVNFSNIGRLSLNGQIEKICVDSCQIKVVQARDDIKVGEYNELFSRIDMVQGFKKEFFDKDTRESWNLVRMSAEINHNQNTRAEALYNMHDLDFDFSKPVYKWLFKYTMGYGYKPYRLIKTMIFVIVLFGLLYSFTDGIMYFKSGGDINNTIEGWKIFFVRLADNMYYSGITITTIGYSDKFHAEWVSKLLAIIESMIGVSLLSLFIFSLTKRYLE